jgi:hypothetical protein
MWFAVVNNLPELILAICWSCVVFKAGDKFGHWRASKSLFHLR